MKNRIVTSADYPPIPISDYNWSARFDWDDGDTTVFGHGETEKDAVLSLFISASEADNDDGSYIEEIIDWALHGWGLK